MGITPVSICVGVVVCMFIEFFMGLYSKCKSSAWIYLTTTMLRTRHTHKQHKHTANIVQSEMNLIWPDVA